MPNNFKLTNGGYNRQQQNKNGAFFANRQDKIVKTIKAQQNALAQDIEVLDMLQIILNYQLFGDNTCGVTGQFAATGSLPELNTGDKVGCSSVEYHNGTSVFAPNTTNSLQTFRTFCGGNDASIFNVIPDRTIEFMADQLKDKNPGIAQGLLDFSKNGLPFACEGNLVRNFTNGAQPDNKEGLARLGWGMGGAAAGGALALLLVAIVGCIMKCRKKSTRDVEVDLGNTEERQRLTVQNRV